MPPRPTTSKQMPSNTAQTFPHAEGHEDDGDDPVLGPIRYLGTATTTGVFSDATGTFADVTSLSLTVQSRGGQLLIFFRGKAETTDTDSTAGFAVRAVVDGTGLPISSYQFSDVAFPTGIISLWSGSIATIPAGWVICDGTNATPDLRDRFIVGAGSTYVVAATGGSTTQATHGTHATHAAHSAHRHPTKFGIGTQAGASFNSWDATSPNNETADNSTSLTHDAHGAHDAHGTNLPPYYALAYIMRTVTAGAAVLTSSATNMWLSSQIPGIHTVKIQARSIGASTSFTIDDTADLIVFELIPVRRG